MIVNDTTLQALRIQVRGEFNRTYASMAATAQWPQLATVVASNTSGNTYGWLGAWPELRQWVGERQVQHIKESAYQLQNGSYESTLGVKRSDIEDDNIGVYSTRAHLQAQALHTFFEQRVAGLLSAGWTDPCYDGLAFFDEHKVNSKADGKGPDEVISNIQGDKSKTTAAWYLLDLSKPLKPLLLQQRLKPKMENLSNAKQSDSVFMRDEFLFGVRWRGAFGYSFWQMAVASREPLSSANYEKAYARLRTMKRDGGQAMGINPTHLIVPPSLHAAGKQLLDAQFIKGGESNIWYKTTTWIVNPYL